MEQLHWDAQTYFCFFSLLCKTVRLFSPLQGFLCLYEKRLMDRHGHIQGPECHKGSRVTSIFSCWGEMMDWWRLAVKRSNQGQVQYNTEWVWKQRRYYLIPFRMFISVFCSPGVVNICHSNRGALHPDGGERREGVGLPIRSSIGKGGIPSQLYNWMPSTEMCLPHLTQPLWIREVQGFCHNLHPRLRCPGNSGLNCLAKENNDRFLPCQLGDSIQQPFGY